MVLQNPAIIYTHPVYWLYNCSKKLAFVKYYDTVNTEATRCFAVMSPSGVCAKLFLIQCINVIYKSGELKTKKWNLISLSTIHKKGEIEIILLSNLKFVFDLLQDFTSRGEVIIWYEFSNAYTLAVHCGLHVG